MKDQSNYEALTILFSPRALVGAWLRYHPSEQRLYLRSLHHTTLQKLELEQLRLFNPTVIGSHIAQWYEMCTARIPLLFGLHGPSVEEHIVSLHTPYPRIAHFPLTHIPHIQWKYTHLYSIDHRHWFYVCGIPQPLLFQYQLLAIKHSLPLTLLTPEGIALAHCYRYLYGTAYRQSHLAQTMQLHNHRLEGLFLKEDLNRILTVCNDISIADSLRLPLLAACGLFIMQGIKS